MGESRFSAHRRDLGMSFVLSCTRPDLYSPGGDYGHEGFELLARPQSDCRLQRFSHGQPETGFIQEKFLFTVRDIHRSDKKIPGPRNDLV